MELNGDIIGFITHISSIYIYVSYTLVKLD